MTDLDPALEAETPADLTPAPEPAPEATQDPPQTAADPAEKPAAEQPFWYRKEIEKERKERQRLERENEQLRTQRQPSNEGPRAPDPVNEPEAYQNHLAGIFERQRLVDRLERSEERLVDKHGEETLESVRDWLVTRPDMEQWAMSQRDPWGAALKQFKAEKTQAEIGDDPDAYRARIEAQVREKLLAEMGQDPDPGVMTPRNNLPAPAATARSQNGGGGFKGPAPLSQLTRNNF